MHSTPAAWLQAFLSRGLSPRTALRFTRARRKAEWVLIPLFFFGVMSLLHREIWQGKEGIGWDLIESYWGDLAFLAREFARHNFPLWNPYERGGVPALADPQPALFYPVQWLLALWAAWHGETSWRLIEVKELLHHALAGTMIYLFLRTRRLPWQAALVGGLAVVCSEGFYIFKSNNFLHALAWAPLCWVAIDALLEVPTAVRATALAASLYLVASVGSPPGYFYSLLLVGGYGVFRFASMAIADLAAMRTNAISATPLLERKWVRLAGCLLLAVVLVGATQALLLLPVRELLALSPRAVRTVDFAVHGECAPKTTLASLVSPQSGLYAANCGVLALVLIPIGLTLAARRDRGAPIYFGLLSAFLLILSTGSKTPVLTWLVVHAPGFGLFQQSCRYLAPFPLALGPLAGFGMAALLEPLRRHWLKAIWVSLVALAAVALTVHLVRDNAAAVQVHPLLHGPIFAVGVAAALLIALAWLPTRWALAIAAIVPLVLYVDTIQVMRRASGYQPRPDNLEDRAKIQNLPELAQYRIYDEFLLEQRAGSRLGLREFRGYTSADPLSRTDYLQILGELRVGQLQILGEYNIRYVFYGPHTLKGWSRKILRSAPDLQAPKRFKRLRPVVYEALHPAPWAAWYGAVRRVPAAVTLLAMRTARDDKGVRRFALMSDEAATAPGAPSLTGLDTPEKAPPGVAGQVTSFSTESVELSIDAPAAGVVVLNEFMFPGWRVKVDGQESRPLTVDLCLRGVMVGKGSHRIRWDYTPTHFWPLFSLWLAGWLAAAAIVGRALWLRPRRLQPPRAEPAPL